MTGTTKTVNKVDLWFHEYLAKGDERTVRKLAAIAGHVRGRNGWSAIPKLRTLEGRPTRRGWDRRAREHDAEVMELARTQLLRRRAGLAEERVELALGHAQAFHALVYSGLTREVDIDEVQDNGSIKTVKGTRPRTCQELTNGDIYAIVNLHNTALATERALLSGASDRYRAMQNRQGDDGPGVTVLGPEAIQEMSIKIDRLVRRLTRATEHRKADGANKPVVQTAGERSIDDWNPDDPNLQWEEVD